MTNIVNSTEQRQVMLGRLAAGLVRSNIYPTLQDAYKAAKAILDSAESITSITKLNAVTAQIRRAVTEIDAEGWATVTKELEEIAIYDAAYYAGLVGTAASVKLSTPPDEKIIGYINKSMMSLTQGQKVDAGTWAQFTKAFASSHTDTLDSIVRNGYAQGQTVAQMAAQMRQVTDGLLKVQAETLARTGVQHYAVNAREAMFLDNDVDEVVYTSTLDNRVTFICMSRDGNRYKMSDPKRPALPAHYGCRSVYIPAIAMQDIETRAAVGGQKGKEAAELFEEKQDRTDKKVKYKGRKDSEIFKAGQVEYTTYDKWLKVQPPWFVTSTLGKERAELFLSGKVSISQFNDLSGRPLTLAQLRALDGG